MKKLISLALLISLAGCASVPMGSAQQDAALKTFSVPSDRAGIYVYRNESMGASVKMDVDVDGKPLGQTASKTYLYEEVAPGDHRITSTAENTDAINIDAKPGSLVFVWQEVKMGVLYARNKLHQVTTEVGEAGVQECHLAAGH